MQYISFHFWKCFQPLLDVVNEDPTSASRKTSLVYIFISFSITLQFHFISTVSIIHFILSWIRYHEFLKHTESPMRSNEQEKYKILVHYWFDFIPAITTSSWDPLHKYLFSQTISLYEIMGFPTFLNLFCTFSVYQFNVVCRTIFHRYPISLPNDRYFFRFHLSWRFRGRALRQSRLYKLYIGDYFLCLLKYLWRLFPFQVPHISNIP